MHFSSELMSWYPVLHIFQVEDIEGISIFVLLRRLIPLCMHLLLLENESWVSVCILYI